MRGSAREDPASHGSAGAVSEPMGLDVGAKEVLGEAINTTGSKRCQRRNASLEGGHICPLGQSKVYKGVFALS